MTNIKNLEILFFFFLFHSHIRITVASVTAHRLSADDTSLATPSTCPAHLFSLEDCGLSQDLPDSYMYQSISRAAARLRPQLRSSPSSSSAADHMAADSQSSTEQPQQQEQQQSFILGLPSPSDDDGAARLDVSGDGNTIKLNHLGPIVVNKDGTMSRITNWDKMTELEQKNTLRVLPKRNAQRLDAIKQATGDGQ